MNLLDIPTEIRLQILCHLLANQTIKVEGELLGDPLENNAVWRMKHYKGLHPAILCTCSQLYSEGQSLMFTNNVFDCSQREGTTLLLKRIGSGNFAQIKHLIIEWDQLQDFGWALAKDPTGVFLPRLESVLTATWRTRILGGKSLVWRQNKNYERQLCLSAINILQKHPKLNFLVQIPYRKASMKSVHSNNNNRVKWRFVSTEQAIGPSEVVIDLEAELAQLGVKAGDDSDEPLNQIMDAF